MLLFAKIYNSSRRPWIHQAFVCAMWLFTCLYIPPTRIKILPKANSSFSVLRSIHLPFLSHLSSHHAVAFFPQRYVTFIREQGLVILQLTSDPLPGSSLASHTLNSHFLDTWAIRLSTNITDTWRQPAAEDRPGWQCVCVCVRDIKPDGNVTHFSR